MRNLSKSKLIAYRQCPRRLWLEIHRPERREDSAATQASFAIGHRVGDLARKLFDPANEGEMLDLQSEGVDGAIARTRALLQQDRPIFEAGFAIDGALAFADVLLPDTLAGRKVWRMVEVKSSTGVKDYYRDDAAIQSHIARKSGVPLASIALAHIDSGFVYPGGEDYRGLLKEADLTEEAFARGGEVEAWIADAQRIASLESEPGTSTGGQCGYPFECGFLDHCRAGEPQAEVSADCLPGPYSRSLRHHLDSHPAIELRDVPDALLSALQRRVKQCTLEGQPWFDTAGAARSLAAHALPAYFLDFETIQFAVPIWAGTRPYQQIPFQWSLHALDSAGRLTSKAFLDLTGGDPSRAFAAALVEACGTNGPIFVYNAGFEGARINELAARYQDLADALKAIKARLVDLHPITKAHYYHPSQHGSWSIKAVLPAVAPELSYEALEGVQDGGMAMEAYLMAIHPDTTPEQKAGIERQLLAYCGLDTFAMVRLWQFLAGRDDLKFD